MSEASRKAWADPAVRQRMFFRCKCGFETDWGPARANHVRACAAATVGDHA